MGHKDGEIARVNKTEHGEGRARRTLSSAKSEPQQQPSSKLRVRMNPETSQREKARGLSKDADVQGQVSGRSVESHSVRKSQNNSGGRNANGADPVKSKVEAGRQSRPLAVDEDEQADMTSIRMQPIQMKETKKAGEPRVAASASSEAIPRVSAGQKTQAMSESQHAAGAHSQGHSGNPSSQMRAGDAANPFHDRFEFKSASSMGKSNSKVPRARRMELSLTNVQAWSVAKVAFLLSIAGGIIQVIAASLLWILLNTIGLFDNITQMVSKTGLDAGGMDLSSVLSLGTVISSVTIFSIFETVFVVALATIGAYLYNVVSSLVGGIQVTLGDD